MPTPQRAGRPRYENSSSLYFAILNKCEARRCPSASALLHLFDAADHGLVGGGRVAAQFL